MRGRCKWGMNRRGNSKADIPVGMRYRYKGKGCTGIAGPLQPLLRLWRPLGMLFQELGGSTFCNIRMRTLLVNKGQ